MRSVTVRNVERDIGGMFGGDQCLFHMSPASHIVRDCPIGSVASIPAVGDMTTKVYNVAQMQAYANP